MNYHVLTLFPEMIENGMHTSITGRAITSGLLSLHTYNIRDYAPEERKRRVDDYPYGGGAGMVMEAEPVYRCWKDVMEKTEPSENADRSLVRTIFLTPVGKVFDQQMARELAACENLLFLCGHYEGIDERVIHWGLCADGRRTACHGHDGCDLPHGAGRAGQFRFRRCGKFSGRSAGVSAVYQTRNLA